MTNFISKEWHNPFRVEYDDVFSPKVAAKRGNPGLCDGTPSEYEAMYCVSSELNPGL
jgi:hypothetical protein